MTPSRVICRDFLVCHGCALDKLLHVHPWFSHDVTRPVYALMRQVSFICDMTPSMRHDSFKCNTIRHLYASMTATHCNILQHTATHTRHLYASMTATHCNMLQHTATHTHLYASMTYANESCLTYAWIFAQQCGAERCSSTTLACLI